jgi:hypothetical protein
VTTGTDSLPGAKGERDQRGIVDRRRRTTTAIIMQEEARLGLGGGRRSVEETSGVERFGIWIEFWVV